MPTDDRDCETKDVHPVVQLIEEIHDALGMIERRGELFMSEPADMPAGAVMATPVPPARTSVEEQLRTLLRRARRVAERF